MGSIPIFAGLGSDILFSDEVHQQAIRDSQLPRGLVLIEACHNIFLQEIRLANETGKPLGIGLDDFRSPQDVIRPAKRYHEHPVVQHAVLCIVQLLRYQSQPDILTQNALATSGFCAGLFAAVAAATSRSQLQFLSNAENCFRAAIMVGVTSEHVRRRVNPLRSDIPWSVVVANVDESQTTELIGDYNSSATPQIPIYISSMNSSNCVTISGEGASLRQFVDTQLPPGTRVKQTNLFSLYHSNLHLAKYRDEMLEEFHNRRLCFPSSSDLLVPLISTVDGSTIQSGTGHCSVSLLRSIIDMILVSRTNWTAVQETVIALASEKSKDNNGTSFVDNYGPGYGALSNRKNLPTGVEVRDLSKDERNEQSASDIAIVGVGVDLPDAPDVETLWQNLMSRLNSCSEIPSDRFHVEDYYNQDGNKPINENRSMATKFGNFLRDPFLFDNQLFGISPREASSIDPQQRLLLKTVYRALESAGYVPDSTPSFSRETFGCFMGNSTLDYVDNLRNDIDVYYSPGTLRAFLSGRVSYAFKWSGPSITLDTACSSSLVSIHQAVRAINAGDCRAAVAGGVNIITSPDMYLGLDKAHFLSSTGQCKAFDESADGYCRSEGSAVFVLKRLSDAINENDRILGVIKGISINQSGQSSSITHPHAPTQEKLFRKLLAETNIRSQDISVVEAHGTGTQAGDPNELRSIRSVFSAFRGPANPLHITSIKSNIGHCEAASGGAALAKLLMMLKYRRVPPQSLLKRLNPAIEDLSMDGTVIAEHVCDWTQTQGRRNALLNNFGAAGSNAALVLQEYQRPADCRAEFQNSQTFVFGCSARSIELLEQMRKELKTYLAAHEEAVSVEDVCYTSTARRGLQKFRLSFAASSVQDLITNLEQAEISEVSNDSRPTVFMFSGQGSQYIGMGKALFETSLKFRSTVMKCHQMLLEWDLTSCLDVILSGESNATDVRDPKILQSFQSGIFVLEVALAQLLIDFGIQPSIVTGHSLGEYAAMVIAGVLSLESGLWLVSQRARLIAQNCDLCETAMLAVNMDPARMREDVLSQPQFEQLTISCENSPTSCVVGGNKHSLRELSDHISNKLAKKWTMLDLPIAYHTAALDPILKEFTSLASNISIHTPAIPIASNVHGKLIRPGETAFGVDYFARHARTTVAFDSGISDILNSGLFDNARWIEIGPHPALLPMVNPRLSGQHVEMLPTLRKDQDASATLANVFSAYYKDDAGSVNWRAVFEDKRALPNLIDLPVSPMKLQRYYVPFARESTEGGKDPLLNHGTMFTVLEREVEADSQEIAAFETSIQKLSSLIRGHIVCGNALCPASVYSEIALAAITYVEGSDTQDRIFKVSKMVFTRPLIFGKDSSQRIRISLTATNAKEGTVKFKISSFDDNDAGTTDNLHCSGEIKGHSLSQAISKLASTERSLTRRKTTFNKGDKQAFSSGTMYKIFSRVVQYSPNYQAVRKINMDDEAEEIFAACQLPPASDAQYAGQPILLDTMLHVGGFAANLNVQNHLVCICHQVQSVTMLRKNIPPGHQFDVHCSNFVSSAETKTIFADAYAIDDKGIIAVIKGMEFRCSELSNIQKGFDFVAQQIQSSKGPNMPVRSSISRRHTRQISGDGEEVEQSIPTLCLTRSNNSTVVGSDSPSEAINILSETTGVQTKDMTPQTELGTLGVDSLMVFELEKRLQKAMHQKPTVAQLSAIRTVGEFEELTSGSPSRVPSPVPKMLSQRAKGATPRRSFHRARSSIFPSESNGTPDDQNDEPEIRREMIELIHNRLGLDEQPEQIQPEGSNSAPLYLIHPGGGMTYFFRYMESLDRAVFAIHDPRIFTDLKDDWSSIDDVAKHYVEIVRDNERQTAGLDGILLGGWSFGGVVAFEVARLLSERYQVSVKGVVLIDAPPPLRHKPMTRELVEAAMAPKRSNLSKPRDKNVAEFEEAMRTLIIRNNLRRGALLGKHNPRRSGPMPPVILLRSSQGLETPGHKVPHDKWLQDRSDVQTCVGEWEELTGGKVEVIDIPGDHFTPFESRNIAGTTSAIREACRILES